MAPSPVSFENYYILLGLAQDAGEAEIEKGYAHAVSKADPRQNPGLKWTEAAERVELIDAAKETLKCPHRRAYYDHLLLWHVTTDSLLGIGEWDTDPVFPGPDSRYFICLSSDKKDTAAGLAFSRTFPSGALKLPTPTEGLLCGLHALTLSLPLHIKLPKGSTFPTLQDLQDITKSEEYREGEAVLLALARNNTDNFVVDQLAVVAKLWGELHGIPIRLGYILASGVAHLVSFPPFPETQTVWISSTSRTGDGKDGMRHYEGLRQINDKKPESHRYLDSDRDPKKKALLNAINKIANLLDERSACYCAHLGALEEDIFGSQPESYHRRQEHADIAQDMNLAKTDAEKLLCHAHYLRTQTSLISLPWEAWFTFRLAEDVKRRCEDMGKWIQQVEKLINERELPGYHLCDDVAALGKLRLKMMDRPSLMVLLCTPEVHHIEMDPGHRVRDSDGDITMPDAA